MRSLHILNLENYLAKGANSDELLCQILDYALDTDNLLDWMNFVETGMWTDSTGKMDPELINLLQDSIQGVVSQIQNNINLTHNASTPTTPEDFFAESTALFEAEITQILDDEDEA